MQQHEGEYGLVLFAQNCDAMFGQFIGDVVGVGGRVAAVDLEQHAADTVEALPLTTDFSAGSYSAW